MPKFLIIAGGGKFGKKALEFAKKKNYAAIIVDRDSKCYISSLVDKTIDLKELNQANLKSYKARKTYFLNNDINVIIDLLDILNPEYIIPVVPIHLIANIITDLLKKYEIILNSDSNRVINFVENANKELILGFKENEGVIYLSYAKGNEICPDNCIGPIDFCPNFKKNKPITITNYLTEFFNSNNTLTIKKSNSFLDATILIESYQLIPGLGGLKGNEIVELIKKLKTSIDLFQNKELIITIATTCNCHGVVNFYRKK